MKRQHRSTPSAVAAKSIAGTRLRQTPTPSPPLSPNWHPAGWVVGGLVGLFFLPVIWNDFVEWDDITFILGNPRLNPPTLSSVGWYWTHAAWNLYQPVTMTLWGILAKIGHVDDPDQFGGHMNPYLFHLASLILHVMAAVVVWQILRRVVRNDWAAAAGALFWGLHPVQVEAVAFAGALNNPLFGALSLTALWQYLSFTDSPPNNRRWVHYGLGTLAFAASMLCKPTAVVTPLLAMLLDWAMRRRSFAATMRPALAWMLMAIPCAIWTKLLQHGATVAAMPLWFRPVIAADAVLYHLIHIVWPYQLTIDYGRMPQMVSAQVFSVIELAVPAALIVLAWLMRRRTPAVTAAVVIFLVALLPNSGLVPFDYQSISTVADRYVYLAMLGPAMLAAWALANWPRQWTVTAAAVALVLLGLLSVRQLRLWRDGQTLFTYGLGINPKSVESMLNLGYAIYDTSPDQAIPLWRRALALNDNLPMAHNNLGSALMESGHRREALDEFAVAYREDSATSMFAHNYAQALIAAGQYQAAVQISRKSLDEDGGDAYAAKLLRIAQMALSHPPASQAIVPDH